MPEILHCQTSKHPITLQCGHLMSQSDACITPDWNLKCNAMPKRWLDHTSTIPDLQKKLRMFKHVAPPPLPTTFHSRAQRATLLGAQFTQISYSRAQRASSDTSWCPSHLPFLPHAHDLFTVSCRCSETHFVCRYWHSRKGLSAFSPHSETNLLMGRRQALCTSRTQCMHCTGVNGI